ncbi:SMP-30/gluconolactonase/LRE family protein [Inquilinus sp. KBS0705]|nr:SMP-30/gluconolactonase/LRE family protein [Inquilinus sp. KBS0705]
MNIDFLLDTKSALGEGPVWNYKMQTLFWVDILGKKIYSWKPDTKTFNFWNTGEFVGFVIFTKEESMLAGYKSGLHKLTLLENNEIIAERIDCIDQDGVSVRFNDGCLDKNGGVWACTMDMDNRHNLGKYYYYNTDMTRKVVLEGYVVANGPAISPDNKILYTVETSGNTMIRKGVYRSVLDEGGNVSDTRLLIDWAGLNSSPDGLITDKIGNLWVGEFGGNRLRCFNDDGLIIREIPLPAWNVTKCAFEGANENILFVTSARIGVDGNLMKRFPFTGGLLSITGLI